MTQNYCCKFITRCDTHGEPEPVCHDHAIHPEVLEIIAARHTVRHIVDLFEIDTDLTHFQNVMQVLSDTRYRHADAAVILLHDTDYCRSGQLYGNTVYNFFRLAARFDLPLERMIFITNHHGLKSQIERLSQEICNSQVPKVIETVLWFDFPQQQQITSTQPTDWHWNHTLFVCPNNKFRQHRLVFLCFLQHYQLLQFGSVSYHFANVHGSNN